MYIYCIFCGFLKNLEISPLLKLGFPLWDISFHIVLHPWVAWYNIVREEKVSIIPEMRWWWWLDSSLLSHPGFSWLDPLFSVWRKWWRGPRPPALSRSVSHTSSSARASVCGIRGQGQPIPLQTITSHRAKYIPTNPPLPVCKAVWCGKSGGWAGVGWGGFGSGPDGASESRWRKTCSPLIRLHITHVRETPLSAQA